jgi:phage terminase large subunit-like protein
MTIDLWFREGWKSTFLTFARPLWELVLNKEERICIFSHTRNMAKSHMMKIKLEMENNEILWSAFPEIFFKNPKSTAPKWSEDDGLYVKSKRNEPAVEAWGLIEKMPTGKHFTIRIYDDIITETAVMTKGQIEKVQRQYRLSEALGTRGGTKRIIGTRYSHKDLYGELLKSKKWTSRIYPAEVNEDGTAMRGGTPIYKTTEELDNMYDTMGAWIYSAQMLQNPTADGMRKFARAWLRTWDLKTRRPYMNIYILVDPATTIGETTDYTCMTVIGTDYMRNYWVLDMMRDKIELGDKWTALRDLVIKWRPMAVGYEKMGAGASDIQYYNMKMEEEGVNFYIIPLPNYKNKNDVRIAELQPLFERGRIIVPDAIPYTDKNGEFHDLIAEFVEEEYTKFPLMEHDDMFDCLANILAPEMEIFFPTRRDGEHLRGMHDVENNWWEEDDGETGSWMAY